MGETDFEALAARYGRGLCLCSDVPGLPETALRVYQGRAFYDGTGGLEHPELECLSRLYGLIVL